MAKALVHGEIVVEVAARRGVKISVDGSGLRECMESSSFQDIQLETTRKLSNGIKIRTVLLMWCGAASW